MKKILLASIAIVLCASVNAAEWIESSISKDGDLKLFYDRSSIKASHYKSIGSDSGTQHQIISTQKIVSEKTGQITQYVKVIDCKNNRSFVSSYVTHNEEGMVVDSYNKPLVGGFIDGSEFKNDYPETMARITNDLTCISFYLEKPFITKKLAEIDYFDQSEVNGFLQEYPSMTPIVGIMRSVKYSEDYSNNNNVPSKEAFKKMQETLSE